LNIVWLLPLFFSPLLRSRCLLPLCFFDDPPNPPVSGHRGPIGRTNGLLPRSKGLAMKPALPRFYRRLQPPPTCTTPRCTHSSSCFRHDLLGVFFSLLFRFLNFSCLFGSPGAGLAPIRVTFFFLIVPLDDSARAFPLSISRCRRSRPGFPRSPITILPEH